MSILSFLHNFETERNYDGDVVEYSTDGGTWIDAGPLTVSGGYTQLMDASTALAGCRAFSGNNGGFQQSMYDVSSFGTTPVQFRFCIETDNGIAASGWYIDNILRANGCGDILRTGVCNNSGVLVDNDMVPMFVSNNNVALPLTLLTFNAVRSGSSVALDWYTTDEINIKDFAIEWSTDAAAWTVIGNVVAFNRSNNSYDFIHTTPARSKNFYRIKMNDRDGRSKYSSVRIVRLDDQSITPVVLIPNLVTNNAVLYIDRNFRASQVNIFNSTGGLVKQLKVTPGLANWIFQPLVLQVERIPL